MPEAFIMPIIVSYFDGERMRLETEAMEMSFLWKKQLEVVSSWVRCSRHCSRHMSHWEEGPVGHTLMTCYRHAIHPRHATETASLDEPGRTSVFPWLSWRRWAGRSSGHWWMLPRLKCQQNKINVNLQMTLKNNINT